MFVSVTFFLMVFTIVSSLNTCDDCIPVMQCASAIKLVRRDMSEKTRQILRSHLCGSGHGVAETKICCDNLINDEEVGVGTSDISNHPNMNLLPMDCGHITPSRLLGGYRVEVEFPWVVRVAYKNSVNNSYAFECMGTLINSRYVLTSAECTMNRRAVGVRVGARTRRQFCTDTICERNIQDVQVSEQITHPEYVTNLKTLNNIGLLRLREPVDLTKESIGVICLPIIETHRKRNVTGDVGTVSFWYENETEEQIQIPLSISNVHRCQHYVNRHGVTDRQSLLANSICTQRSDSSCSVAPGSPLILEDSFPDSYKYLQYGVSITGTTRCGPGIFTDVSKYVKWILDTIKT